MHAVVVVGAGPVGLTAALTLARAGVDCVLLEDDARVCDGSRALGMSRRTLEIWDALGAADSIRAHGLDWKSGRSFYRGKTILSFEMPDDSALRHRPMFNIPQCFTEEYLVQALDGATACDLRWQSRFTGLHQFDDHVLVDVSTPEGDYRLRARYLVACDGARSAVRTSMGLQLEGTSYEASYVIADIELDSRAPMERRCWFDPPSNPGLTVLMHGQPDRLWRLDYQLGEHEDPAQATEVENVERRIQQHLDFIGETGAWRLDWFSPYRVHSRALERFCQGRVAFAGDAAHLMPIFGIRGLNSGVEDAWNLGWKLADVLHGRAAPALLDAYSAERRAVFVENTALASRNALFMTPPNQGIRCLRDAVLSLALGDTPVQDILNPKQAAYVPLRSSPLFAPDPEPWAAGPGPGDVVPDLLLADGAAAITHLQAAIRGRFCVLCFSGSSVADGDEARSVAKKLQALPELDVWTVVQAPGNGTNTKGMNTIADPHGDLHRRFGADAGASYLVRPDHHVVARWKQSSVQLVQAALAQARPDDDGRRAATPHPDAAPAVPISAAEQMYQCLGNALDAASEQSRNLLLMKLALRLGLDANDPAAFARAVAAAAADLDPAVAESRTAAPTPEET